MSAGVTNVSAAIWRRGSHSIATPSAASGVASISVTRSGLVSAHTTEITLMIEKINRCALRILPRWKCQRTMMRAVTLASATRTPDALFEK